MTTVSFSIDEQTKEEIERIAKEERRSKSEIFREMYESYRFKKTLSRVQQVGQEKFLKLGIESIDQAEEYLG